MKYVYVRRGDGLGTRILSIMQAKILSDYLGFELRIVWPSILAPHYADKDILSDLDLVDVFDSNHFFGPNETNRGDILSEEGFHGLSLISVNAVPVEDLMQTDRLELILDGKDGLIYGDPYQVLTDAQLGLSVSVRMKSLWSHINWSDGFLNSVSDFEKIHRPSTSVAIHARRGDIVTMLRDASLDYLHNAGMEQLLQRFVAVRSFLDCIAARNEHHHDIIVCGEGNDVADAIAAAFERRRVVSTRMLAGSETKKAFMDLYILSRSSVVIAPYHSYFSGCAAILGSCRFEPIQLNVPDGLDEIFSLVDSFERSDKVAVKSLACSIYGRMLSEGTRVKIAVDLEKQ